MFNIVFKSVYLRQLCIVAVNEQWFYLLLFFFLSILTAHNCTYELGQRRGKVTGEVNMVRVF